MTYRTKSGKQIVVIATGQGNTASLMAFDVRREESGGRSQEASGTLHGAR